eukprot:TRINITY_DN2747_c0_g2_i2.p1 TRINITY_DN2747_c0_g2~~TRINITY_DN2747_c0_g2_i2.p1  ORF type:complete len:492 (-),score=127.45 TRINITY_DN2747_c0_g2_i2:164-1561(-)
MAVPVQTWGSLGTMVAEQREFGTQTAEYLEANEIYDLFGHLLKQIIIHQPTQPLKFLQDELAGTPALSICVMGPPGVNRSKYCQQLAQDFNVKHIQVGKLLRAKKELKDQLDSGMLIDDGVVIPLVKAEVMKSKAGGYVLDGFPRTKVQAQILSQKELGFSLDNMILLTAGESVIREAYTQKLQSGRAGPSDSEELINMRLQGYLRHVIGIAEQFKNILRQVEVNVGDDDQNITYGTIKSNIHLRTYSNAPTRPHRICVIGPCGSGRSTQAKALAKQFGLVHVDVLPLLGKQQMENGNVLEDVPPEYVSDEDLCAAVGRRLSETDCIRKGWVLDGFPKTQGQAEFLRQSHLWPTRIIDLKVSLDTVVSRIGSRRIDPVTCTGYYKSPSSVAVRQRLVQAEHDLPEAVRDRYNMYADNVDRTMQTFPAVSSAVRGDEEVSAVMKNIREKVEKPLAHETAQESKVGA